MSTKLVEYEIYAAKNNLLLRPRHDHANLDSNVGAIHVEVSPNRLPAVNWAYVLGKTSDEIAFSVGSATAPTNNTASLENYVPFTRQNFQNSPDISRPFVRCSSRLDSWSKVVLWLTQAIEGRIGQFHSVAAQIDPDYGIVEIIADSTLPGGQAVAAGDTTGRADAPKRRGPKRRRGAKLSYNVFITPGA